MRPDVCNERRPALAAGHLNRVHPNLARIMEAMGCTGTARALQHLCWPPCAVSRAEHVRATSHGRQKLGLDRMAYYAYYRQGGSKAVSCAQAGRAPGMLGLRAAEARCTAAARQAACWARVQAAWCRLVAASKACRFARLRGRLACHDACLANVAGPVLTKSGMDKLGCLKRAACPRTAALACSASCSRSRGASEVPSGLLRLAGGCGGCWAACRRMLALPALLRLGRHAAGLGRLRLGWAVSLAALVSESQLRLSGMLIPARSPASGSAPLGVPEWRMH